MISGMVGGSIVYFILHGACPTKKWLSKSKKIIDKKIRE